MPTVMQSTQGIAEWLDLIGCVSEDSWGVVSELAASALGLVSTGVDIKLLSITSAGSFWSGTVMAVSPHGSRATSIWS